MTVADPAPETVTDAVRLLTDLGYTDELTVGRDGLTRPTNERVEGPDTAIVDYLFRFEGPTDPADEAIVMGVTCPTVGARGVVVSAYGPGVDEEHDRVLAALVQKARRR